MVPIWQLYLIFVAVLSTSSARNVLTGEPPSPGDEGTQPLPPGTVKILLDKTQTLVSGWRQLNDEERRDFYESVNIVSEHSRSVDDDELPNEFETAAKTDFSTIKNEILLYSRYNYLYYYPTISWNLDKTPDTSNYWVGIYRVGETDNKKYITYKNIGKKATGSYYVAKLEVTAFLNKRKRSEEFELRIFSTSGYDKRLPATTNILRGIVHDVPALVTDGTVELEDTHPVSPKHQAFITALEMVQVPDKELFMSVHSYSKEDLRKLWSEFDSNEQQLLLPMLEQDCLPHHVRTPSLLRDERPSVPWEGEFEATSKASGKPEEITLTIKLDHSYTYVYPVVNVKSHLVGNTWLGLWRAKR